MNVYLFISISIPLSLYMCMYICIYIYFSLNICRPPFCFCQASGAVRRRRHHRHAACIYSPYMNEYKSLYMFSSLYIYIYTYMCLYISLSIYLSASFHCFVRSPEQGVRGRGGGVNSLPIYTYISISICIHSSPYISFGLLVFFVRPPEQFDVGDTTIMLPVSILHI